MSNLPEDTDDLTYSQAAGQSCKFSIGSKRSSKGLQRHEAQYLPKREIKRLVKELPINKLGPSLIPFAVSKKFLSPYKIFKKVRLAEYAHHSEYRDLQDSQRVKLIAQEWSRLSVEEKKIYQQNTNECKSEYVHKMSGARIPFLRKRRGRSSRDRTMPEAIDTPFRAFVRENKALFEQENPDYDYHDIKNLMEDIWDVLDQEQIQYYENLAKEDKWRYIEEWEAWLRQRFGQANPAEPLKFPDQPQRPKNGYRIFCDLKKTEYTEMMPKSQQHEISGLVQRCWNSLTPDERQIFEEEAQVDIDRYRKELSEYHAKINSQLKKTDDISRLFVTKLRTLQEAQLCSSDFNSSLTQTVEDPEDMFESVADQAISQINNLRKDSTKLIKQSRRFLIEDQKERQKAIARRNRPKKLVQRTLYSQIEEMNERIEADETRSVKSEAQLKMFGRKKSKIGNPRAADPFYKEHDNEEDYLLTHLSLMILEQKKELATVDPIVSQQQTQESQIHKDIEKIAESQKSISQNTTTVASSKELCSMDDLLLECSQQIDSAIEFAQTLPAKDFKPQLSSFNDCTQKSTQVIFEGTDDYTQSVIIEDVPRCDKINLYDAIFDDFCGQEDDCIIIS